MSTAQEHVLLVREPSSRLAEGQVSHIADERDSVDAALAKRQWGQYVDCFRKRGWRIVEVAPSDESPDGVFIEDQIVYFHHAKLLVCCSPGAPTRESEVAGARAEADAQAKQHGLQVARIERPGTLDGGDVLKVEKDRLVYVGKSARTNDEGRRQLRALLEPHGYTVQEVPVTKALHLKSAVTALPDGTVIGWDPIVDDPRAFQRYLSIPEEHGVAVVVLSDKALLMSDDAPKTTALLRERGFEVQTVGISEFERLEGW